MSSGIDLGYLEALYRACGDVNSSSRGGKVRSLGPQAPREAVRKVCTKRTAAKFGAATGTSSSRNAGPMEVPRPPPQVGLRNLEVYGDVARDSLASRANRPSAIGSGDYPESFKRDEWNTVKPTFFLSWMLSLKGSMNKISRSCICYFTSQRSASETDLFEPCFALDATPLAWQRSYLRVTQGCDERYHALYPQNDFADFWNIASV